MDSKSLLDSFGGETVKQASSGKATPICKLLSAEGNFLHGVLLGHKSREDATKKDFQGKPTVIHIYSFKLIASNTEFILKNKKEYEPTKVAVGDEVTIYGAPAKLVKHLANVAEGEEVLILYKGKTKEKEGNRTVEAHRFDVRKRKAAMVSVPD